MKTRKGCSCHLVAKCSVSTYMILLRLISTTPSLGVSHHTRPSAETGPSRDACGPTCHRRTEAGSNPTGSGSGSDRVRVRDQVRDLVRDLVRDRNWHQVQRTHLPRLEVRRRRGRRPDAEVDENLHARAGIWVALAAQLALRHREAGHEPLLHVGVGLKPDQGRAQVRGELDRESILLIHLPTYLPPTCLPTFSTLPTYPPTYHTYLPYLPALSACLPTHLLPIPTYHTYLLYLPTAREREYLNTYQLTYLLYLAYLPTYLPYLPYLPTYLPACLPACLPTHLLTIPTYHTYLPYLPTHLPTYLPAFPTYLPGTIPTSSPCVHVHVHVACACSSYPLSPCLHFFP